LIPLSGKVRTYQFHGISCAESPLISESDRKEQLFWRTDPLEAPDGDLFDNIVEKASFIKVFKKLLPCLDLTGKETILEVGGGHCWASALIKRSYPDCYVIASDLIPEAVQSAEKYEAILQATIDEKWSLNCRKIPFKDEQFDRVFTFAAFHHFGFAEKRDFRTAIQEVVRVLRPGGKILLLYERFSPKWLYKPAAWRANKNRASISRSVEVDEDQIILSEIKQVAEQLNCNFRVQFLANYEDREGVLVTNYYYILTRLKPLQKLLPGTVNIIIEKF
jgi:SAM-dependent methyltransferase